MATRLERRGGLLALPLFLLVFGFMSAAMLIPSAYASILGEHRTAQAFLYSGMLGMIIFGLIALAHAGRAPRHGTLGPLMALFCAFVALPAILAVPFYEGLGTTVYFNAYFEMVSAITTTGATVFENPARLNAPLHLWRAMVGWFGGLLMWIAAAAILAPLNLGGFEVTARAQPGRSDGSDVTMRAPEVRQRVARATGALLPIYVSLTMLLWLLLIIGGDVSLTALCHAMSVMATSGISPVGGIENGASGVSGEAVMFLFMLFALSRLTFSRDTAGGGEAGLWGDPELRIGLLIVVAVPLFLFLRHWLGAFDVGEEDSLAEALSALWGGLFTVLSFLSTTGFISGSWEDAQSWSGLGTTGILLMALALIGGGVATTAGGVKLLRVFALYQNGLREMERLVHPSSVSGAGKMGRRLQRDGAFIAWIFFMLFAISIAGITLLLSLIGVPFDTAMIMAVSGLSTTGPVLSVAGEGGIALAAMPAAAKGVYIGAMVIGRLETLAIIALLTPDLWRG
ncbi:MAG: potassium transporter TrkG [Pseudomonadota bacterium]